MNRIMRINRLLLKIIHRIEDASLVVILSLMIIVASSQVILRFLTLLIDNLNLPIKMPIILWFDSFIKYSVLWLGLIAAGVATRAKKHINIDIIGRFAKGRMKNTVFFIINIFSSSVCLILCIAAILFIVNIQIPSEDPAPFLNIPKWVLISILPISLGTIGLRFLFQSITNLYNLVKNIDEKSEDESDEDSEATNK